MNNSANNALEMMKKALESRGIEYDTAQENTLIAEIPFQQTGTLYYSFTADENAMNLVCRLPVTVNNDRLVSAAVATAAINNNTMGIFYVYMPGGEVYYKNRCSHFMCEFTLKAAQTFLATAIEETNDSVQLYDDFNNGKVSLETVLEHNLAV